MLSQRFEADADAAERPSEDEALDDLFDENEGHEAEAHEADVHEMAEGDAGDAAAPGALSMADLLAKELLARHNDDLADAAPGEPDFPEFLLSEEDLLGETADPADGETTLDAEGELQGGEPAEEEPAEPDLTEDDLAEDDLTEADLAEAT